MKRLFLSYLIYFSFTPLIFSQNDKTLKNKISLSGGINYTYLKDLNFSPLNIHGSGVVMDIHYSRKTKKENIFQTKLLTSISELSSSASSFFKYERYFASFEINYLKKISKNPKPLSLYAGGGVFSTIDFLSYKGVNALSFFSLHGFHASIKSEYQLNKRHCVSSMLSVPIIGLLNRPPYTGWDKFIIDSENNIERVFYRGDIATLGIFLCFDFEITYTYSLSKTFDIGFKHMVKYWHTKESKKAIINTNFTSLELTLKF